MKKRLAKKWINRYIKPVVGGLPSTMFGYGDGQLINYTIVNGEIKPEACRAKRWDKMSLRKAIKATGQTALEVLEQNKGKSMYLRVLPEITGRNVYMRLIADPKNIMPRLLAEYESR